MILLAFLVPRSRNVALRLLTHQSDFMGSWTLIPPTGGGGGICWKRVWMCVCVCVCVSVCLSVCLSSLLRKRKKWGVLLWDWELSLSLCVCVCLALMFSMDSTARPTHSTAAALKPTNIITAHTYTSSCITHYTAIYIFHVHFSSLSVCRNNLKCLILYLEH